MIQYNQHQNEFIFILMSVWQDEKKEVIPRQQRCFFHFRLTVGGLYELPTRVSVSMKWGHLLLTSSRVYWQPTSLSAHISFSMNLQSLFLLFFLNKASWR